jgi:hypothetical protein
MNRLSVNEICRPVDILNLRPDATRRPHWFKPGDHDVEPEPAVPTTPADPNPAFNHDHE